MRKTVKVQASVWLKGFLLAILLHSGVPGFTSVPVYQPLSCIIDDLQRSGPSQNRVTYTWSAVSGATVYKVFYTRLSDGYSSPVHTTSATTYTSPVLSSGAYRFYFAAVCENETLSYIADDIIIN